MANEGRVKTLLTQLNYVIGRLTDDVQGKYLNGLNQQVKYLAINSQKPAPVRYKRGQVLCVEFGWNVGAEFGGDHFAVVWKDSTPTDELVLVIPLSSLDDDESKDDLHSTECYLGTIPEINEKRAFAKVDQIQSVSKHRVSIPRVRQGHVSPKHRKVSLENEQLDSLDKKLLEVLFGHLQLETV